MTRGIYSNLSDFDELQYISATSFSSLEVKKPLFLESSKAIDMTVALLGSRHLERNLNKPDEEVLLWLQI
jgi:hypothetical protein